MLFGNHKYETIDDTMPFQHFLIDFCLCFLSSDSTTMLSFVKEALELLGIETNEVSIPMQAESIRDRLIDLQTTLPPKAAGPCIPADEPVFLLRSKDPVGPAAVEQWIMKASKSAVSADRLRSAIEQLARMKAYQQASDFGVFR